ncbi:glycosyltransferase family 8 protein [Azomonas macrocytogenes]|uniref:Lipopolysaccharide biosynthesis glycosyltransferase n=1 Tax=Azomonas macrocytogenes TaxID=69962 RepID=A0A839T5Y8_AZOMA|nr:glycosyltransferase family 8 protein [Azomonas macrocytogenes]MBB3104921.1 lipopolysaccharide biosynthesis glycosyltransferase [Azomonas macrocytogenes]
MSRNIKNAPFHIAFGVDENYIRPMGVTITSIIKNNPDSSFVFHIFSPEISQSNLEKINKLSTLSSVSINVHIIEKPSTQNKQINDKKLSHISEAAYTRILIPKLLHKITNNFLYLDADILCTGDISSLFDIDISNVAAAVVRDINSETMQHRLAKKQLVLSDYFNSGVLYINISYWLANNISEKVLEKINDPILQLGYFDQDALNVILDHSVFFIDSEWNYQYPLTSALRRGIVDTSYSNKKFIHFIGPMKPWRNWNPHNSKELFLKYQDQSPWSEINLDDEFSPREAYIYSKYMCRTMLKQRRWHELFIWYTKFKHLKRSRKHIPG